MGNPGIPTYYRRMRPGNQAGAARAPVPHLAPLLPDEVLHLTGRGAVVLDTRVPVAFGGGHIPQAYNIGFGAQLATWAGWLMPQDVPMILVLERDEDSDAVATALWRVGFEHFAGYLSRGMDAWTERGFAVGHIPQVSAAEVHERAARGLVRVLDVRQQNEWREGHIPGALHLELGLDLPQQLDGLELDLNEPVAVVCLTSYRSSIAASVLMQRGFHRVENLLGGMTAWLNDALPVLV